MRAVETGSSVGSSYVDALAYAVSSCVTEPAWCRGCVMVPGSQPAPPRFMPRCRARVLASARHWPRYGQFRRHAAGVRAALDTLEPIPSTTLLSAQEAKDRLREIIEGFFFQRLGTEDGRDAASAAASSTSTQ